MHVRQRAEQGTGRYHMVVADGQFAEHSLATDPVKRNARKQPAAEFGDIGAGADAHADIEAAPVVTGDWHFLNHRVGGESRCRHRDEGDCPKKEL